MILQEEGDEEYGDQEQRFNSGEQPPQYADPATRNSLAHGDWNSSRVNAGKKQRKEELVPREDQSEYKCSSEACENLRQANFEKHLQSR